MIDGGVVLPVPFLDIRDRVDDSGNEQGLLGLAFHPDHADDGYFYVNYSWDPPGSGLDRTRISRFTAGTNANVADPGSELVLMEFDQPCANHNGGDIQFGPDGYLYIASGDGGSGGDPQNNAQNPGRLLGKLLRIDVDGGGAPDCNLASGQHYGIPPDNAYTDGTGGAGCDEIYGLGLRNPWRIAFDALTGDLVDRGRRPERLRGNQLRAGGHRRRPQLRLALLRGRPALQRRGLQQCLLRAAGDHPPR
ncbi:PQQ-dependent sugar dehydrogenase [Luteimonas terricola]|uniref:Glucose/Sorbosone dehydrogenase domain-containing protein n=1 Tax=Luteimonas terricola TaxID=645597 RepID=A0ABQ2E5K1_9GAMM|nr:PQQ-dependent sugar dehydrogenase [Luteimonas terricola]GGJ96782.1 hypothetical protein GCM10011394_02070 [Luteimonas terricola]